MISVKTVPLKRTGDASTSSCTSIPSSPVKKIRIETAVTPETKSVVFFFNPPDEKLLAKLVDRLHASDWTLTAVSGYIPTCVSRDRVRLIKDNGQIARRYRLLDPLGGGVYPLSTIIVQRGDHKDVMSLRFDPALRFKTNDEILNEVMKVMK
ncbi:unnamed protein product [Kuraishia capsulata CBS 1993]|uniref:Uncharacterized protein n=1 Tax=Kuraishia capsulata CBS 1993 TaxID=1382522 RepID=W6MIX6_9ASCO|nr:uncharacterized protein KUCA_T00002102001 [Kuraishia capsulata CBS 1993]CDK26131.1 unnamed protein product [Kuraishia capsulata CBS 1993]